VHSDSLLAEWVQPQDFDDVRPAPPPPPDGFFDGLAVGDQVTLWFEAGWWPVKVRAREAGGTFQVGSDVFPGLSRQANATTLRPNWRWGGKKAGWTIADKK